MSASSKTVKMHIFTQKFSSLVLDFCSSASIKFEREKDCFRSTLELWKMLCCVRAHNRRIEYINDNSYYNYDQKWRYPYGRVPFLMNILGEEMQKYFVASQLSLSFYATNSRSTFNSETMFDNNDKIDLIFRLRKNLLLLRNVYAADILPANAVDHPAGISFFNEQNQLLREDDLLEDVYEND